MCAVVGAINVPNAYNTIVPMLHALQYRGENGSGLALASYDSQFLYERTENTVPDLVIKMTSSGFKPSDNKYYCGLGHNRYGTFGDAKLLNNAQPFKFEMPWGWLFLSHNGDSPFAVEDRKTLMEQEVALSTTSDSEIILQQMGLAKTCDLLTALRHGLRSYRGTYALCMLTVYKGEVLLIAARDPFGNRPLVLGRLGGGYVVASENSAFEVVNAVKERDVEPGEIVIISQHSVESCRINADAISEPLFQCIYEHGYFSLPTSEVFGIPVVEFRKELGRRLANHYGGLVKPNDIVTYVPDSSEAFADGFCEALGHKLTKILLRRHSSGRSFTKESQVVIDETLNVKFSFYRSVIEKILEENPDARFWIVEDSVVRGSTIRKIIRVLRGFGVKFVGVLSGMPPLIGDCGKGINMRGMTGKLIAAKHIIKGSEVDCRSVAAEAEANFIGYQSLAELYLVVKSFSEDPKHFCYGCFDGTEPVFGKW
ncbi:MAG: hypothetical protein A3J46_05200 [Candidatus Yanofskybacteria bacterium RIFCSPHIGHO2_02_FULL_41_11]|uniref:Amidophosphoribosyltransferase n=1 Tax=Candidatus Yanofskybacteria bacterium RIFCSPHIGHO2_02_FULL_41_11 TaxID=1802675 RepID=A0A1F8F7I0_9BACT|nr:MAG: hypothetical protein A3J46_05200 [Candidatus Yanofskybacteria bacterium RIFCSPHIGHO2_02_FULL_41_11]